MQNRSVIPGIILIAIGIGLLVTRYVEVDGGFIVLLIGTAFLISWAVTKTYGLLIPGAIMAGLGAGIIAESQQVGGDTVVVLGLGLGFLAIWPLDRLVSHGGPPHGAWWPFIPGGILTVVGIAGMVGDPELIMEVVVPVVMVIVGAFLAIRAVTSKPKDIPRAPEPPAPPTT